MMAHVRAMQGCRGVTPEISWLCGVERQNMTGTTPDDKV